MAEKGNVLCSCVIANMSSKSTCFLVKAYESAALLLDTCD